MIKQIMLNGSGSVINVNGLTLEYYDYTKVTSDRPFTLYNKNFNGINWFGQRFDTKVELDNWLKMAYNNSSYIAI